MKSSPPNDHDAFDRDATDEPDHLDVPDAEATADMLTQAEELGERVADYRDRATAIDDEFERNNEDRNYGLDDLPFGEELIRTRELPFEIHTAQQLLERIQSGELDDAAAARDFQRAALIVEEVETTLTDCKSIPPPELDDDEYDGDDDSDDDAPSDEF